MWRRMTSSLKPHHPSHSTRCSRPPRARVRQWGRCLWRGAVSSLLPMPSKSPPPPLWSGDPPVPYPYLQNASSQLSALIGGRPQCRWMPCLTCSHRSLPHFGPPGMCRSEPTRPSGQLAANRMVALLLVQPTFTKHLICISSSEC